MKRALAAGLGLLAGAAYGQVSFPAGMPDDARQSVREHLILRSQESLQALPLADAVKKKIRKVDNKAVLDAIERDARLGSFLAAVTASGTASLDLPSSVTLLGAKVGARLDLLRLSTSNIPDAVLASVRPDLSKERLAALAAAPTVELTLLKQLSSVFPQHFKLKLGETVYIYNPKTPVASDLPADLLGNSSNTAPLPAAVKVNRDSQPVWRVGFNSVAALVDVSANPHHIVCSGVVLESRWFLTAAHCLFDMENEIPLATEKLSVFLPFQDGGETIYNREMQKSARMLRAPLATSVSWLGETSGRNFPRTLDSVEDEIRRGNDILLLQLSPPPSPLSNPLRSFQIPAAADIMPPLTMAGYGRTNAAAQVNEQLLEVGVQPASIIEASNDFKLAAGHGIAAGRVCSGDSGGPIFRGDLNGRETSPFNLVAIASAIKLNPGGLSDPCIDGTQLYTRVDRPEVRRWLCTKAGVGC